MGRYDDIINLPHHVSEKRMPMPMRKRAAQFAPFKALSGYEDKINEVNRVTEKTPELDEEQQNKLNRALLLLKETGAEQPFMTVTYFVPDAVKPGGKYVTVNGNFRVLDFDVLKFTDGKEVLIKSITDIDF